MSGLIKILFGFLLVAVVILFSAAIFESFLTSKVIEIKVTKIERTLDEEDNVHYFIHTPEEVFRNENNYYHGKSNQESLIKLFEKEKSYKVEAVGYKLGFEIPFFIAKYRNIIKIVQ